MDRVWRTLAWAVVGLAVLGPLTRGDAQTTRSVETGANGDVIVTGMWDVVVNGRARHCHVAPGDPLNNVMISVPIEAPLRPSVIAPNRAGGYSFGTDDEPVTGPVFWQRAGRGLDQYVFHNPGNGQPLCIGGSAPEPNTFAQYRQIVDAAPYRGKRVRFTAWVATGGARLVNFWLAAGWQTHALFNGGNTNNQPWGGNHGWTPVLIEIGPIAPRVDHLSYGFLLHGPGDVWVYKPTLEVVRDDDPFTRAHDVAVIGGRKR